MVEIDSVFRRLPDRQPAEGANAANECQVDAMHGDPDTQQVAWGIPFGKDE